MNYFSYICIKYAIFMAVSYMKAELVIVFKNTTRANAKIRIKVFKNKTIDDLIESINNPKKKLLGIPTTAEYIQIGVGDKFAKEWKKKYKI